MIKAFISMKTARRLKGNVIIEAVGAEEESEQ
jgi:hypothetical protein